MTATEFSRFIQLFQCDGCHNIFASETHESYCKQCLKRRSEYRGDNGNPKRNTGSAASREN